MTHERDPRNGKQQGVEPHGRRRPEQPGEEHGSKGKDHKLNEPDAEFEFDPATRRTPQGGGPD